MAAQGAWICGIGMMTAVGDCAAQTAASVRAGISRYRESETFFTREFKPMTLALLPEGALPRLRGGIAEVRALSNREERMLRLAGKALEEVLPSLSQGDRVPLFLAVSEPHLGGDAEADRFHAQLLDYLLQKLSPASSRSALEGRRIGRERSRVFPAGRAGGFHALAEALAFLSAGEGDHVLLGGVDTCVDHNLLAGLDAEGRVLAEGVMDGFAPGEGAVFLLLSTERARAAQGLSPPAYVHPPGLAQEPGHRYSSEPCRGDGLAQALALGLAALGGEPVHSVYGSLNGENFGAKEWGVSVLRSRAALGEGFRFEHPAECVGDVGAAFAPLLIGLAAIAMAKGYRRGPCLVWCSSERELRGAACLTTTAPGEG